MAGLDDAFQGLAETGTVLDAALLVTRAMVNLTYGGKPVKKLRI